MEEKKIREIGGQRVKRVCVGRKALAGSSARGSTPEPPCDEGLVAPSCSAFA